MKTQPLVQQSDIYSKPPEGKIFSPFNFCVDKMEHLILINFEKDPDECYNAFELQKACDSKNQTHLLVIAYCNDGSVDIYHQGAYPFGSQAHILNNVVFFERKLEDAKFEISADLLEVYFSFTDKKRRQISVSVTERKRSKKRPFYMLAPVGVVSKQPMSLPVYSLYEMSFTKQKHTGIFLEIDKKMHKPDAFPMPVDCSKNYFTRYSADTFNVDWNKTMNGALSPLTPGKDLTIHDDGTIYDILDNKGYYEIGSMRTSNGKHEIAVHFTPSIPELACLKNDTPINGQFKIKADKTRSYILGKYSIITQENRVKIQLQANEGWHPNEPRFMLNLLYQVVKIFREWPKTYVWNAEIAFESSNEPLLQSSWSRI